MAVYKHNVCTQLSVILASTVHEHGTATPTGDCTTYKGGAYSEIGTYVRLRSYQCHSSHMLVGLTSYVILCFELCVRSVELV